CQDSVGQEPMHAPNLSQVRDRTQLRGPRTPVGLESKATHTFYALLRSRGYPGSIPLTSSAILSRARVPLAHCSIEQSFRAAHCDRFTNHSNGPRYRHRLVATLA